MYFNNGYDTEKAEFDAQRLNDATDIDAYIASQADYAPRYNSSKSKGTSAKPSTGGSAIPRWLLVLIFVLVQIAGAYLYYKYY